MSDLIVGDKYRLRRELGQGAMGSVWSATHELLDREVAIKFLLPSLEGSETAAARFVAEAKAAARVKHRYVVDVFDFGITEGGFYYMVQELLEGVSLADCMYTDPAWPLTDLLRFTAQCLSGLEAVHQCGIIHRDLKPENIFVIRDAEGPHPKLLDFGISKFAESPLRHSLMPRASLRPGRPKVLTAVGTTLGTPAYMSPEQLCNAATITGRADLYSLGVVLYEWLSGRVPFGETSNPTELYRRIQERSAPSLKALRPELDLDLCEIVDRALDPDPALRFASAAEMRAEILRVLPAQPLAYSIVQRAPKVDPQPIPAPPALPLWAMQASRADAEDDERVSIPGLSRSRTRSWAIGGLALACVALLAVASWMSTDSSPVRARPPVRQETVANTGLVLPTDDDELSAELPALAPASGGPVDVEPGSTSLALGVEPPLPAAAEVPVPSALPVVQAKPEVVAAAAAPAALPVKAVADAPAPAALPVKPVAAAPAPAVRPPKASGVAALATVKAPAPPPPRPIERVARPAHAASPLGVPPAKAPVTAAPRAANKNDKVVRTLDF